MKDGEFLFRKSFYQICQEISDPKLRLAAYEAICEYGIYGKNDWQNYLLTEDEKSKLKIVLPDVYSSIDNTKKRYIKAVENGRKGGLKGGKLGGRGNKKKDNEELKERKTEL